VRITQKIKAGTLVETLVGTTIIIILFIVATLVLNGVFKSVMKNNTLKIDNKIYKLQYLYEHHKIKLPYRDNYENWEIIIFEGEGDNQMIVEIKAENKLTKKIRVKKNLYEMFE